MAKDPVKAKQLKSRVGPPFGFGALGLGFRVSGLRSGEGRVADVRLQDPAVERDHIYKTGAAIKYFYRRNYSTKGHLKYMYGDPGCINVYLRRMEWRCPIP